MNKCHFHDETPAVRRLIIGEPFPKARKPEAKNGTRQSAPRKKKVVLNYAGSVDLQIRTERLTRARGACPGLLTDQLTILQLLFITLDDK